MTRSFLAVLTLALSTTTAISQTAPETPRPLAAWDISEVTPESLAACGAFLTKIGFILSRADEARHKSDVTDGIAETLFRGLALSAFTKQTDPALADQAWDAEFDPKGEPGQALFFDCTVLADSAIQDDLIPQEILDNATKETVRLMLGGS